MKDLLKIFKDYFETNDEFKRQMEAFVRVQKTKEWAFFITMLRAIQGIMVNHMLSVTFSNMSAEEKDAVQKSYYYVNKIIDFLLNPLAEMRKRKKWAAPIKPVEPGS